MAELRNILENEDFTTTLTTVLSLGNNLSRSEIEAVISENGLVNPVSQLTFYILDERNKFFIVVFSGNTYKYTKLKLAG